MSEPCLITPEPCEGVRGDSLGGDCLNDSDAP